MDVDFYKKNSYETSKLITKKYSTSFSLATSFLEKDKRHAIYAIYGFVRLADEIVDSFHGYEQTILLENLHDDLEYALKEGISTNTLITAYVDTVKKFQIKHEHIQVFMESMKSDLSKTEYTNAQDLRNYIYGSADAVGLMCLKVFCNGCSDLYDRLEYSAQKLGSAFQKVNFLRDLKEDINDIGRSYFPEITNKQFDKETKRIIEGCIEEDFGEAWKGVRQLPGRSKLAVALAYYYYTSLFRKIKYSSPEKVLSKRIRISNFRKYMIILKVLFMYGTKLI